MVTPFLDETNSRDTQFLSACKLDFSADLFVTAPLRLCSAVTRKLDYFSRMVFKKSLSRGKEAWQTPKPPKSEFRSPKSERNPKTETRKRKFVSGAQISDFGFLYLVLSILATGLLSGCMSLGRRLPPVDLKEPGWTVREGQAVWQRKRGGVGVAGDILVATRPDGRAFVQFSKPPFPLISGQLLPGKWQVEIPPQNRRYSGSGNPPKRILFLYLPRVLAGKPPPENWTWRQDTNGWRLENHVTGESLEGYFNQ